MVFDRGIARYAAALAATVAVSCAQTEDGGGYAAPPSGLTLSTSAAGSGSTTQLLAPLPGKSARTVLQPEVNEAENIDFTDDGRLFVSGGEDIYELTRAADGTVLKTDYFHEDCLVEGIVHSGRYLYGVCTDTADDRLPSFLIAGELSERPVLRRVASLQAGAVPNGLTVDPEGRIYITYWTTNQIVRLTLASGLEVSGIETWASELPFVNGIKYVDHAIYVTTLDADLSSSLLRVPVRQDGRAGAPQRLYQRPWAVIDDIIPFAGGFVLTDFLQGTLIFWDEARGVYAETPDQTFFGPTSLVQGRAPLFDPSQLIVAEKGTLGIRDELDGDLVSAYQLPVR